jgi:uncharacterized metal-binding protein YceD (DUF177 family)
MTRDSAPEFSRPLAIADLRRDRLARRIEASPSERDAVARRLGLKAVDALTADLKAIARSSGRAVEIRGHIVADVVQTCVVSLEPFASRIEDDILTLFTTGPETEAAVEVDIDPEAAMDTEPLTGGTIDLGELTVQTLALALDPHPRKPDATFKAEWGPSEDEAADEPEEHSDRSTEGAGPFAALARLKGQR